MCGNNRAAMLHINDLTYRIGPRVLLDHATVALPDGAKTGLVGRNGSGKTTLFRLITGEITPETGSISLPKNARVGQVAQEAPSSEESLIEVVLAADTERNALLAEAETATDPHRIAEIQIRLADIDAHSAEARAAAILAGLGFDAEDAARPVLGAFPAAGGCAWRSPRCCSPSRIFSSSTSRPTISTSKARCGSRATSPAIRAACSSSATTATCSTAPSTASSISTRASCVYYRGTYDSFDRQRRERQALQLKLRKKQEDQRRHMEAFVERFRYKASKATPGAVAAQGAGPARADRRDHRRVGHAIPFPDPKKKMSPPIVAHGRRLGRL